VQVLKQILLPFFKSLYINVTYHFYKPKAKKRKAESKKQKALVFQLSAFCLIA